jgi:AraC-like DNA-binding protein
MADDGGPAYVRRPPSAGLRALVADYCGFREAAPEPVVRREWPTARIPLIVHLGAPYAVTGADGATAAPACGFVAGLHQGPARTVTPAGGTACLQLDLAPVAAHRLLGVPMAELADRVVGLEELLGRDARELQERLGDAASWEARFALLDAFLLRRLADAERGPSSVAWAWHALRRSGGRLPIRALADELGCSHRHLIAGFRREVGLPPKAVARIVRFERALHAARASARPDWAAIAHDCGYADQSHLVREVRALAGTTPTALVPAAA